MLPAAIIWLLFVSVGSQQAPLYGWYTSPEACAAQAQTVVEGSPNIRAAQCVPVQVIKDKP